MKSPYIWWDLATVILGLLIVMMVVVVIAGWGG